MSSDLKVRFMMPSNLLALQMMFAMCFLKSRMVWTVMKKSFSCVSYVSVASLSLHLICGLVLLKCMFLHLEALKGMCHLIEHLCLTIRSC